MGAGTTSAATTVGRGAAVLLLAGIVLVVMAHPPFAVHAGPEEPARITLPPQYRDYVLISVAHEAGGLNDLRAILGNEAAVHAYRAGAQTMPDGALVVRVAWTYQPSDQNNQVFGKEQSFVAGSPTNIQLMIKDAARFKETGGWGYAQFADARAANSVNDAAATQCFHCHTAVKNHDYLFTHYAP